MRQGGGRNSRKPKKKKNKPEDTHVGTTIHSELPTAKSQLMEKVNQMGICLSACEPAVMFLPTGHFMPLWFCLKYSPWNYIVLSRNCHFTKCFIHYLPIFIFLWTWQIISLCCDMHSCVIKYEPVKLLPLLSDLTVSCGFCRVFLLARYCIEISNLFNAASILYCLFCPAYTVHYLDLMNWFSLSSSWRSELSSCFRLLFLKTCKFIYSSFKGIKKIVILFIWILVVACRI